MKLLLLDSFSLILGDIIFVLKVTESPIQSKLIRLNNYINLISRPSYLTEWFRFIHAVRPMTQWFDHWPNDPVPLPSRWLSRVLKLCVKPKREERKSKHVTNYLACIISTWQTTTRNHNHCSCCFWISKLLYLDFQILLSTEAVTRLSHDQVALFKTFRGTAQNCARQTINHAASRIKQAQLQLFG